MIEVKMKSLKLLLLIAIALSLAACSFTVDLPSVDTGVTQTFEINEPVLEIGEMNKVEIEMGAGSLTINAGAENLVEGTVQYNVTAWQPKTSRTEDTLRLSQQTTSQVGFPQGSIRNIWDLKLGSMPIDLSIANGASESNLFLGGLSLTRLAISDGASKTKIRFDEPNLAEMSVLTYSTGASEVTITGLANANTSLVTFEGGVGMYELDFSGTLTRDMQVNLDSGVSDVKLIFPSDAHVQVVTTGELNDVDFNGTWTVSGNIYEFGSTGPLIRVDIDMAVGHLQLVQK
jgi:hypothetical protein